MQLLGQRAFTRADGTHQVKHLAALFAFQRCGVEIADNLRNGFFDAEEFFSEKIVKFYRFVFIKPLDMRDRGFRECRGCQF
jgi:hypothetical protein